MLVRVQDIVRFMQRHVPSEDAKRRGGGSADRDASGRDGGSAVQEGVQPDATPVLGTILQAPVCTFAAAVHVVLQYTLCCSTRCAAVHIVLQYTLCCSTRCAAVHVVWLGCVYTC